MLSMDLKSELPHMHIIPERVFFRAKRSGRGLPHLGSEPRNQMLVVRLYLAGQVRDYHACETLVTDDPSAANANKTVTDADLLCTSASMKAVIWFFCT